MKKTQYHAVIFDLDGTLLNTLDDIAAGTNYALARAGFPVHPVAAYRHFVGNGVEMLLRRATPPDFSCRLPGSADFSRLSGSDKSDGDTQALRLFETLLQDIADYHKNDEGGLTRPFAGIPELLAALTAQGIRLAVLSNKPQSRVVNSVPHFFPGIPFFSIWGATPDYPLKPDPAAVLAMAASAGLAPENVVYLGDSNVDMITARNAGMFGVGAGWGFRGEEELRAAGAGRVFMQPLEVLELWNEMR